MITSGKSSHFTKVFILHPLILRQLADGRAAVVALHGRTTADRNADFTFVQAVQRTVHAAGRSGRGGGLLRTLHRAQCGRNIKGTLERTELLRLKREVLIARRSGRVIRGGGLGRVDRRRVAVDSESRGGSRRDNVGSHLVDMISEVLNREWKRLFEMIVERSGRVTEVGSGSSRQEVGRRSSSSGSGGGGSGEMRELSDYRFTG